ncbi:hypothetical protein FRB91_007459 [Serendipita sp. 411]|nr:hypothetical protein FRC16_004976 [Serendipita sp. 398]KAG8782226.1 hypothetical protein FRC15_007290 [Serendipita sp. 397]KAG8809725.1 hypothetical protein FRC19_005055 [Serendipita sp. 401]KAG8841120.1 hypothetical protein FRC20_005202 [Serendipita sp. 405]KAG8851710.1 hypothetical protein FRB91_007459 [Serendipita sp. 411]KAG9031364.1 hypothetical protein FS842_004259 [Serendipita sp. 407]
MAPSSSSENAVVEKYDKCLADLIVKSGIGLSVGVIASVVLFKRRAWPVALSTGVGIGMSYSDCERSFGMPRIPGTRVLPPRPSAPLQSLNTTVPSPPSTPSLTPEKSDSK